MLNLKKGSEVILIIPFSDGDFKQKFKVFESRKGVVSLDNSSKMTFNQKGEEINSLDGHNSCKIIRANKKLDF